MLSKNSRTVTWHKRLRHVICYLVCDMSLLKAEACDILLNRHRRVATSNICSATTYRVGNGTVRMGVSSGTANRS